MSRVSRRHFLKNSAITAGIGTSAWLPKERGAAPRSSFHPGDRVTVIDVTDLYHPYEDPGDNLDLIQPHALPEVDLRAIVLDVTDAFRLPVANDPVLWHDPNGPREPGIIPVSQLNALFGHPVPFACGPYTRMQSLTDPMTDAPPTQQEGIELILRTLQENSRPVHIVSFGSLRTIAAAFNREPQLLHRRVKCIHVSAGTASKNFEYGNSEAHNSIPGGEWNVALDPFAFIRVMRSDLPIALYPCADVDGAFAYGEHNTYWNLPDLHFVREMDPRLRNYVIFALGRLLRPDFFRALDETIDEGDALDRLNQVHHVWETAIWLSVSNRKVVFRNGTWQIVPASEVRERETVLRSDLQSCVIRVRDDGRIAYTLTSERTNWSLFTREDPRQYEFALRQALPLWWKTFRSTSPV